jgi:hypothetical protein
MRKLTSNDFKMKDSFKISGAVLLILSFFLIYSCKKDKPTPPVLTTTAVTAISYTTATSGGNITADNGASVTTRGVCWGTSQNPTTSNSISSGGSGTGNFTSSLTNLTTGTTYYVRAYATNSAGTGYGTQVSFTTDKYPGIRLKTGTLLNSGAYIYFLALSKDVNYFNLTTTEKFAYRKTDADWYIDGDIIPFTTNYKEFTKPVGTYYLLLSGSGTVVVTTITVAAGDQTVIVSGTTYGGISISVVRPKKSVEYEQLKLKLIEYFIPGQTEYIIQR